MISTFEFLDKISRCKMVIIGDTSYRRRNVNRKAIRPPKRRTQTTKNSKTVRRRKAPRRVGNVFVPVRVLHNILFKIYIFTRYYTNSSVKQLSRQIM